MRVESLEYPQKCNDPRNVSIRRVVAGSLSSRSRYDPSESVISCPPNLPNQSLPAGAQPCATPQRFPAGNRFTAVNRDTATRRATAVDWQTAAAGALRAQHARIAPHPCPPLSLAPRARAPPHRPPSRPPRYSFTPPASLSAPTPIRHPMLRAQRAGLEATADRRRARRGRWRGCGGAWGG
jgi:hypothetical protein